MQNARLVGRFVAHIDIVDEAEFLRFEPERAVDVLDMVVEPRLGARMVNVEEGVADEDIGVQLRRQTGQQIVADLADDRMVGIQKGIICAEDHVAAADADAVAVLPQLGIGLRFRRDRTHTVQQVR